MEFQTGLLRMSTASPPTGAGNLSCTVPVTVVDVSAIARPYYCFTQKLLTCCSRESSDVTVIAARSAP